MKFSAVAVRLAIVGCLGMAAGYVVWQPKTVTAAGGVLLVDIGAPSIAANTQSNPRTPVVRTRNMAVNFNVMPGRDDRRMFREPPVILDLFPDVTIVGAFDRYDPNPDGVTWVGHVEGIPASFITLVYGGGQMAGSIVLPDGLFQIRPASADARRAASQPSMHVVSEIDQSAFLKEATPIDAAISDADRAAAANAPTTDTADVVDLMVLYTAQAAANAGGPAGIANLINLGVSETNTSYANSGVSQRIRLVHTAQVGYAETNDFSGNLTNLRNGTGALSGVASLRDSRRADLVMMLVHPPAADACGIAFLMTAVSNAFAPAAYSVVDTVCVSPNYSFAHELGHNMGARHDWFVDSGLMPSSYAHGHVDTTNSQRWRTIMAYPDNCTALGFSCTRLLFWANPETKYLGFCGRTVSCAGLEFWKFPGISMGVKGGTKTSCVPGNTTATDCDADDSRTLNESALTVANFRQGG